jgi:hypothetical protein
MALGQVCWTGNMKKTAVFSRFTGRELQVLGWESFSIQNLPAQGSRAECGFFSKLIRPPKHHGLLCKLLNP